MGKLTEQQREIIGSYCTSAIRKASAKKQVAISCSSKEGGTAVAGAISAAYPSYKLYRSQNIFGSVIGYIATGVLGPVGTAGQIATDNWKDFTVRCDSASAAEKLVKEIGSCIEEYGVADGSDIYVSGSGKGTGTSSGLSTSSLLIIAAVVVVVVLVIVLTRKKK